MQKLVWFCNSDNKKNEGDFHFELILATCKLKLHPGAFTFMLKIQWHRNLLSN